LQLISCLACVKDIDKYSNSDQVLRINSGFE
jgi:hypothetical protein